LHESLQTPFASTQEPQASEEDAPAGSDVFDYCREVERHLSEDVGPSRDTRIGLQEEDIALTDKSLDHYICPY
jgi:hypothetical protein